MVSAPALCSGGPSARQLLRSRLSWISKRGKTVSPDVRRKLPGQLKSSAEPRGWIDKGSGSDCALRFAAVVRISPQPNRIDFMGDSSGSVRADMLSDVR